MSWRDRLRPEIQLTSPQGKTFSSLWKGNEISAEKRIGRHSYPNIDKEVVQDLGMNSRNVPLTLYFDGPDNDKVAEDFQAALYEKGIWQIVHPVYGLIRLQLISYKLSVNPIEAGNVTIFETEWIEPADDNFPISISNPAAEVETSVRELNNATVSDMETADQSTLSKVKAISNSVKQNISTLKNIVKSTNARVSAIQNQINELANSAALDLAALSGGIIELIEAPGLMAGSMSSKITVFSNLGKRIIADFSSINSKTTNQTNSALTMQLFLNAITAGMANTVLSETVETRSEAVFVMLEYQKFTNLAQTVLDEAAAKTVGNKIEGQFFVRTNSGEAAATLNASVARYLLRSLFDLKIERRIILERPRAPIEITISEYKANAETLEALFNFFCKTNELHGRKLLLLPTEYEVVIYG